MEKPVHRIALVFRPIKTHVMLKLLLSANRIFRQEKARKTLTLFYYKIIWHLSPVTVMVLQEHLPHANTHMHIN